MGYRNTLTRGRKRNYIYQGLVVITVGTSIVTAGLAGIFMYLTHHIQRNQAAVTTLSNELSILEEQTEEIKAKETEYKDQLEQLEAELSRYKPIVIPETMKPNQN